jgi:carboxyl-terminal processing protease
MPPLLYYGRVIGLIFVASLALLGCRPADPGPGANLPEEIRTINQYVHDQMNDAYLWAEQVPPTIGPFDRPDPGLLLADLRNPADRWSNIDRDEGAYRRRLTQAQEAGHGFFFAADLAQNLRIALVYPGSPASEAGLRRGLLVRQVNGQAVNASNAPRLAGSVSLLVEEAGGQTRTVQVEPRVFTAQSVLHREVKTVAGRRVGYLVYQSFTTASEADLNQAFNDFKAQNIGDLVVDLRYNGGGLLSTAQHLASLLAPAAAPGRDFARLEYNRRYARNNQTVKFEAKPVNLGLRRVFFIVTGNTASASEFLINGLRPQMEVQLVGSRTVGKFFGSPILEQGPYTFTPITLQGLNERGENFPQGLVPQFATPDDRTRNWGDERENLLAAVLHYLARGNYEGYQPSLARTEAPATEPAPFAADGQPIDQRPVIVW